MIIAHMFVGFLGALLFSLFLWPSLGLLTLFLAPIAGSIAALIAATVANYGLLGRLSHKLAARRSKETRAPSSTQK